MKSPSRPAVRKTTSTFAATTCSTVSPWSLAAIRENFVRRGQNRLDEARSAPSGSAIGDPVADRGQVAALAGGMAEPAGELGRSAPRARVDE